MKRNSALSSMIRRVVDRLQASETLLLGSMAVATGLAGGIGVWAFKGLINFFHWVVFVQLKSLLHPLGDWSVALLPLAGGLVVGVIVQRLVGAERHHGVAGIMEAVALAGGRLRYWRMPAKSLAAALSIGSGASVGPEDPSVQIGASLGSMFGRWLKLSDERVRTLVAAGAAAGIAAAFNAPIAGVFFALEIILGEIAGSAFGMVVIASVVSAVFTQAVSGAQPAFRVPAYAFNTAWELPLYLGLGLLAGPVAAWYVRILYAMQDFFNAWRAPRWLKPAVAGLAVGLVGIYLPQVLGVGYETIEAILNAAPLGLWLLLALLVAKLVLTPLSIAGGFMGGVFAPSLFLGATLGGAYGLLAARIPGLEISPAAFAMVGMAAVLAGAVHAPLTATLLLFEMTHDYRIILPLMFSVAVSLLISQYLQRDSVYMLGLARKGVRLDRGRDVEVLQAITVSEVMQTDATALPESTPLPEAVSIFARTRRHGMPVINDSGDLVGILTVQDLDSAATRKDALLRVGDICSRKLVVTYPDETIGAALQRMAPRDLGRLPVVARENSRKLLGILRRSDVIRSYQIALTRRAALRHRAHQAQLDTLTPELVGVTEITLLAGSPLTGKMMKEIPWPHECVIASLRRGRLVLIPHGDTVLHAGDVLVAVVEDSAHSTLQELCTPRGSENV